VAPANAFLVGDDVTAGRLINVSTLIGAQPIFIGAYRRPPPHFVGAR
jgi:hypothetical protein